VASYTLGIGKYSRRGTDREGVGRPGKICAAGRRRAFISWLRLVLNANATLKLGWVYNAQFLAPGDLAVSLAESLTDVE